jgi:hypothetical protein
VSPVRRWVCLAGASAIIAIGVCGCSTVIRSETAIDEDAGAAERAALRSAAFDLAKTPWPKPSTSSFAERLAGVDAGDDQISRDDAVDAYLAALPASGGAEGALMADAERHLELASALKDVAEIACDRSRLRLGDVALLEDAISDLRETRSIYVASIRKLDGEEDNIDMLKESFDRVIKDLGEVADDLADKAMKEGAQGFAGPDAVARTAGSF